MIHSLQPECNKIISGHYPTPLNYNNLNILIILATSTIHTCIINNVVWRNIFKLVTGKLKIKRKTISIKVEDEREGDDMINNLTYP